MDRRTQARLRAARERVDRLERALEEVQKLPAAKMEDKKGYEPKVSTTDPEARIMKTSEGGYAPSYNVKETQSDLVEILPTLDELHADRDA